MPFVLTCHYKNFKWISHIMKHIGLAGHVHLYQEMAIRRAGVSGSDRVGSGQIDSAKLSGYWSDRVGYQVI
jgi:hypothetical protein